MSWDISCFSVAVMKYADRKHSWQWFSTFLTLQPLNTVPHVGVTSPTTIKLFWMLLHNYNFAAVRKHNVNTCVFQWTWVNPVTGRLSLAYPFSKTRPLKSMAGPTEGEAGKGEQGTL